ncbi:3098_t:CDS:2 [Funneliformis caledonium]|uniref:3098_t:CDS:1 n=1 Tax=Funneliformis caledonium TaxID=1117310 RepID=A0A9N9API4_9GLOM|nr:3098_t:CDS:2 [Funneliformis caledonium]
MASLSNPIENHSGSKVVDNILDARGFTDTTVLDTSIQPFE